MRKHLFILFARQVITNAWSNKASRVLLGLIALLLLYAAYSGLVTYQQQTHTRLYYQQQVRSHWEHMPDKHPHRMAHYGYIAFRAKHPLSFFDFGVESYTGNAVFLEAHRQNTVNFSEAGFSSGLLRFGEISLAMILQVLVPLVLFFLGFSTVAADRENGTLKILLSQGASWSEMIAGKALGLLSVAMAFLLPVVLLLVIGSLFIESAELSANELMRIGWISLTYLLYFAIVSLITVVVSAVSQTAKLALVSLIGIWLLFTIILPRTTQALGNYLYPAPSKIAFETAIEGDILKTGDSHDPNDPYYKTLKDSVLNAYGVKSVEQLPFNYSGFQMKEGERLSAAVYNKHLFALLKIYEQQNSISRLFAFINPYSALRSFSMAISGTDFGSYVQFQQQAEAYRYHLAQHMNELQIKLISNKKLGEQDKPYSISKDYWKAFPDFAYVGRSLAEVIRDEALSLTALLIWITLLFTAVRFLSQTLKAI
jgi:ABC-2 type transport system permease protein